MHIIAGIFKNKPLITPKGEATRPTSGRLRESLFNICQSYIEGATFLDLFAGSGAIGLEALSRGAKHCTFVDNSRESIRSIQQNVETLHLQKSSSVVYGDVFAILKKLQQQKAKYDVIYADPPYEKKGKSEGALFGYSEKVLQYVDEHSLLNAGGFLFIEDARTFIPQTEGLRNLKSASARRSGRSTLHQFVVVEKS